MRSEEEIRAKMNAFGEAALKVPANEMLVYSYIRVALQWALGDEKMVMETLLQREGSQ